MHLAFAVYYSGLMKRNDLILAFVIVILSLGFLGVRFITGSRGGMALVYEDRELIKEIPLYKDDTIVISTKDHGFGEGNNTLVVENGSIRVTDADCPDGLCIGQGRVWLNNESIICLPHHLTVKVSSSVESDVDAVPGR